MKRIIFEEIIRHHDITYAQRIYQSVVFANKMIEAGNASIAEKYVSELYKVCVSGKWDDDTIFTKQVVSNYASKLPQEMKSGVKDSDEVIGFWLSYCFGVHCTKQSNPTQLLPILMHMMYSSEGSGFIHGFIPNPEFVRNLIQIVDFRKETLLKHRRIVQDDDVIAYIEYYLKKSQEELLKDVSYQSFYEEFHPLPDNCILLAEYLVKAKLYKEWIDIFSQIQIPFLQVEMFSWIDDYNDVVELYKEFISNNGCNNRVSREMFMNIWFRTIVKEHALYIKSLPIEDYDEEISRTFCNLIKRFNSSLNKVIKSGIKLFVEKANVKEVSEWIFGKSLKHNETFEENQAYNNVLKIAQEVVANCSALDDLNAEAKDIHYLAFVASRYTTLNAPKENKNKLLENIWKFIESKDFYWSMELDQQNLSDMRSFARLLVQDYDEKLVSDVISRFRVKYEGINASPMNDWSNRAIRESYVYCVLLLMLESRSLKSQSRKTHYKQIVDTLLKQACCCGMDLIVESDYYIALIVAEVIADQIEHRCKTYFENGLADNVYHKETVLRVLSFAKTPISKSAITKLYKFRDNEWQIIRKDYLRRKQTKKVEEIENLFVKLSH